MARRGSSGWGWFVAAGVVLVAGAWFLWDYYRRKRVNKYADADPGELLDWLEAF